MNFNVSIYDLISWAITIISTTLFFNELKKNNRKSYYMAVQGILRACKSKAGYYGTFAHELRNRKNGRNTTVSMDEFIQFAEGVTSDYMSLMEHVMGSLKAIEPDKDSPFDTMDFTKNRNLSNVEKEGESPDAGKN